MHIHSLNRFSSICWAIALGLLCGLWGELAWANSAENSQKKLEALRSKIASVQGQMLETQKRQDGLTFELGKLERHLGRETAELNRIRQDIKDSLARVTQLKRKIRYADDKRDGLQEGLGQSMRAVYSTGKQPHLRMLLNQQDPDAMGRMLTYYRYYQRSSAKKINILNTTIGQLESDQQKLFLEKRRQQTLAAKRTKTVQGLKKTRLERQGLLAKMQRRLTKQGQNLARLEKQEDNLQDLVNSLQGIVQEYSPPPPKWNSNLKPNQRTLATKPRQAFTNLKGQLKWPVAGRIQNKFGGKRAGGRLKWNGVVIAAKRGADVKAVAAGRVVYAGWMSRMGLLVIVDHGNDYLTLYAHNEVLNQKVGEWVETGAVIAEVGDTGGRSSPGLYFEIRKNTKQLNPAEWCRSG